MFSITSDNKLSRFIIYFIIFGASSILVYVAKGYFKGILSAKLTSKWISQVNSFSKKSLIIFLYTISSFSFLFGLLIHVMDKYNLLYKYK